MPDARARAIRAAGIVVRFGGLTALDDARISAEAGAITGLIGPNGAGKTTLFNVLCGFTAPASGAVWLGDEDVTTWPVEKRAAAGIGRTFQRLEIFRHLSVIDNCVAAYEARSGALTVFDDVLRLPRARRAERDARTNAREALDLVGLGWAADRQAGDLPLGLGRLLELARALCVRPRVLLLDEPSSGLHPNETDALGDLLRRITGELGLATILVEHDVGLVARVCEHVFVLDAGAVIAEGTPDEVRADERVVAAYLGTPV